MIAPDIWREIGRSEWLPPPSCGVLASSLQPLHWRKNANWLPNQLGKLIADERCLSDSWTLINYINRTWSSSLEASNLDSFISHLGGLFNTECIFLSFPLDLFNAGIVFDCIAWDHRPSCWPLETHDLDVLAGLRTELAVSEGELITRQGEWVTGRSIATDEQYQHRGTQGQKKRRIIQVLMLRLSICLWISFKCPLRWLFICKLRNLVILAD